MATKRIVREIAMALVAEAVISNKLADVMSSVDIVAHVFDVNPDILATLGDRSIPKAKRIDATQTALKSASPFATNAIKLLIDHDVLGSFDVFRDAAWTESERHGHRRVAVTSAEALSAEDRHAIEYEILQKLGGTVSINEHIDASLLGGVIVAADEWKYDASIAGKLRKLTHTLTN